MTSSTTILAVACALFVASTQAGYIGSGYAEVSGYAGHEDYPHSPPHYQFKYAVHDPHTGDVKDQWEQREGDVVKGSYSLVEADGTHRHVEYTADDHNGFNAVVKKSGKAVHPVGVAHGHGAGHGLYAY